MKKIKWITPNKMEFKSLHKTFNRQVSCISTGTQIGNTVYSSYIRPYFCVECNGRNFSPGHLQEYDLNWIVKDAPKEAKDWIRKNGKYETFILYVFFHRVNKNGHPRKIIHGAVITDRLHNLRAKFYCRDNEKSKSVIDEAIKYITN